MPNEQLRFWLEVLASIAGVAALAAIALELLRARRADVRDFLLLVSEKYQEIYDERRLVNSFEFSNMDEWIFVMQNEEKNLKAYTMVFNFWDLLTKSVKANAIDKRIAFKVWGRVFMIYYEKFSQFTHELVEFEGGHDWYENFDWFAEEYMKHLPGDLKAMKKQNELVKKVLAQTSS